MIEQIKLIFRNFQYSYSLILLEVLSIHNSLLFRGLKDLTDQFF